MGSKYVAAGMDEQVAQWVCAHIDGMDLGEMPYSAIGQVDGMGNIVGGAVFNNYTGRDIHVHVAGVGRNWVTRRFLGECFRYIFVQLGCRRCTGLVARSNTRAIQFDEGLGFKYEGILRAHLKDDEDCFIYGMLREECRWLTVGVKSNGTKAHRASTVAGLRPGPRARAAGAV